MLKICGPWHRNANGNWINRLGFRQDPRFEHYVAGIRRYNNVVEVYVERRGFPLFEDLQHSSVVGARKIADEKLREMGYFLL